MIFYKKIFSSLLILCAASIILTTISCNDTITNTETAATPALKKAPGFNADSAYAYTAAQCAFGPRVPGTKAQQQCAAWMQQKLQQFVDTVYVQNTIVTQPVSGKKFPNINVIGVINPKAATRVLLLCHWDSRGFADEDANKANHTKPIDAADDGASGVGVLLEMARAMKQQPCDIGIDILFADVEDMGKSEWEKPNYPSTYCLGTRYWAQNPHVYGYRANFGICLDMVGAKGATFRLEQQSKMLAGDWQKKVWNMASQLGHSSYFLFEDGGSITDDHMEINQYANIPCIDVINTQATGGFATHWHTLQDNMQVIDRGTLKAVGETMLGVLYNY